MTDWDIDVEGARRRIRNKVRKTPVFGVSIDGIEMVLKLEQMQLGGSFKIRGASNAIAMLPAGVTKVVAASGGNHGIAVALAARAAGVTATVVVPELAPKSKCEAIAAAGAEVIVHGTEYAESQEYAQQLTSQTRAHFLHAYADPNVIAGQGTLGLELLDQAGGLCDSVVIAIGGGGLIACVATALSGTQMRVLGVEPQGAPTIYEARRASFPVNVSVNTITAPALGARKTAAVNLTVVQQSVEDVVLVGDDAIVYAQSKLWETCRLAVEPAGATALAGVLTGVVKSNKPCVVLCGANIEWDAK